MKSARSLATLLVLIAVVALVGWFAWWRHTGHGLGPDATEPNCAWSVRIEQADVDQQKLSRCYLRAIARHDDDGLRSVVPSVDNGGPTGFTPADFAHSADARRGVSTVIVTPNGSDSADATVVIRYVDGVVDTLEIHWANPVSAHSWRVWNLGTRPNDSHAPAPASK